VADRIDRLINRGSVVGPEADHPAAVKAARQHLPVNRPRAVELHLGAAPQLLAGVHQRFPPIGVEAFDQDALDGAAARHAPADQPRGEHARVVDDEEVAGAQPLWKHRHDRVCEAARFAIQNEQPRGPPFGRRLLRDQIGRQVEVEVRDIHPRVMLAKPLSARPSTSSRRLTCLVMAWWPVH
jgi:hypothetical protein